MSQSTSLSIPASKAGFALVLSALGLVMVLGVISLSVNHFVAIAMRGEVDLLNRKEGFYASELSAWHSHLRSETGLVPVGSSDSRGRYATLFDTQYDNDLNLPADSYEASDYEAGRPLNLSTTMAFDSARVLIRRHTQDNIRYITNTSGSSCGSMNFSGHKRVYVTCLTVIPPATSGSGGPGPSCTVGKITTDVFNTASDDLEALALQKDGKILAIGKTEEEIHGIMVRYHPDLTLDNTFGSGGKVIFSKTGYSNSRFHHVALQEDGKIVVSGEVTVDDNKDTSLLLARYSSDGTLDTSFSNQGVLALDLEGGGGTADSGKKVAIQKDGKIVVLGYSQGGTGSAEVRRFNSDGTADTSFADNGKLVSLGLFAGGIKGYSLSLQPDDKILLGGSLREANSHLSFGITRFHPNGSPDTTFGDSGKIKINWDAEAEMEVVQNLLLDPRQNIFAFGSDEVNKPIKTSGIVKIAPSGTVDTTFGNSGMASHSLTGSSLPHARAFGLQQDEKSVWAYDQVEPNSMGIEFALIRVLANGLLDTSFGTNGHTKIRFRDLDKIAYPMALVIEKDDKILVGGISSPGSSRNFALACLNPDGTLP